MSKKLSELRNLRKRIAGITMPIVRRRARWGRNWLCLCGSGQKYKKCCMAEIDSFAVSDGNANIATLSSDVQKMVDKHKNTQGNGGCKTK